MSIPPQSAPGRSSLLCLLLVASTAFSAPAAGFGQQAEPQVRPLQLPEIGLAIDRPSDWWVGGTIGYGVVASLIGRGDGFPNFSVMTDPEFDPVDGEEPVDLDGYVEALFEQITGDRAELEVHEAGWDRANGFHAHLSTTSWKSVAGRLVARRMILVHEGRPYIFTWSDYEARYPEIAELVERCLSSIRAASAARPGERIG